MERSILDLSYFCIVRFIAYIFESVVENMAPELILPPLTFKEIVNLFSCDS